MVQEANRILNDPTMTPLATEDGTPLVTEDGETFIITSTTLTNHGPNAQFYRRVRNWLRLPKYYVRGK